MIEKLDGTRETVLFREGFGIRLYLNSEPEDYPLHWHTAAEVILPLDNLYTVRVNDATYTLHPGDILIIPPGELHEITAPETGERLIMQFDLSLLHSLKLFDATLHLLRPALHVPGESSSTASSGLQTLLLQLRDEYLGDAPLKEAAAYGLLIQFFVQVGREIALEGVRSRQARGTRLHQQIDTFLKVCRYMNEHCTRELRVEELAELAGYSKFHFTRLFKSVIGMSYYDYLIGQRIMRAELLLADPALSVTEVAMRAGFGSLATFNRAFKAYRQCTPTQYRELYVNWQS